MSKPSPSPSVQRFADAAAARGLSIQVVTHTQSTRTAQEAADVVGCEVAQIVKSLVFTISGHPVVALVSGGNQLDTAKLARLEAVGRKQVQRADADAVRSATGYAIGGVPPFGFTSQLTVYVDDDLTQFDTIWAAAGTPNAIFAIAPDDLIRVSGGQVADLKVD